ncbi:MAG: hypothetical protein SGPRY_010025 [Prymnesium sp.]
MYRRRSRHAFVSGKNPEAARYCTETPLAARRRFKQHAAKLASALAVLGYIDDVMWGGSSLAVEQNQGVHSSNIVYPKFTMPQPTALLKAKK